MIRYRVANSGLVGDDVRRLLTDAIASDTYVSVFGSLKWVMSELERTPLDVGESRANYEDAKLKRRIIFVGPLTVEYAVHESAGIVFVKRVRLTPPRKKS